MSQTTEALMGIKDRVTTQVYEYSPESWPNIRDELLKVEKSAFGIGGHTEKTFIEDISNNDNITVLLKENESRVIGYVLASPDNEQGIANVEVAAIADEFRGQRLIGVLKEKLEQELRVRNYKRMRTMANIANGYADAMQRHYGQRVIMWEDRGEQRYIEIVL